MLQSLQNKLATSVFTHTHSKLPVKKVDKNRGMRTLTNASAESRKTTYI